MLDFDTDNASDNDVNKGGNQADPVREHYVEVEPKNAQEAQAAAKAKRQPVKCKHCNLRFTVSGSRVSNLRGHSLICQRMPTAGRQEHINRKQGRQGTRCLSNHHLAAAAGWRRCSWQLTRCLTCSAWTCAALGIRR